MTQAFALLLAIASIWTTGATARGNDKWGDRPLNVVMIGKTGVGKSALANALLCGTGKILCSFEEGAFEATTKQVNSETVHVNGVKLVVHDTPGFFDGEIGTAEILAMLNNLQVDLVIFCARFDDTRVRAEDREAVRFLKLLTKPDLWNHTVVALTFANKIGEHPDPNSESEYQKMLRVRSQQYRDLLSVSPGENAFERAPVIVPVGYRTDTQLSDGTNWLSELWLSCFEAVDPNAQPAFLKMGAFPTAYSSSWQILRR